MPFSTIHDVPRGLQRLMRAPRDLPPSAPWTDPAITRLAASAAHVQLFDEYVEFLGEAMDLAEIWWEGLIEATIAAGSDRETAVGEAYRGRFAGPAACPEVVWTLRTFWIRCVAVNVDLPATHRVPPEVFLLEWLLDGAHLEWVQVITGMPYWPIGLDGEGNWV